MIKSNQYIKGGVFLKAIVDAAIIFISSFLLLPTEGSPAAAVGAVLAALTVACLQFALPEKRAFIPEIVFALACLFFPPLIFGVPIVIYGSVKNSHYISVALCALFAVCPYLLNNISFGSPAALAALVMLSVILGLRTGRLIRLESELLKTRDSDAELFITLKNKNRSLLEKQDYEIYLATLKERNRIAREIHDNVGHLLSRSLLQTGALLAITDKEKQQAQYAAAQSVKATLDSAMNSIRESVHGLRDDSIDLKRSVEEAVSEMRSRYRLHLETDFSENMPAAVKLCFIASVKEAVSNIVKHSDATEVSIVIREHPALYQLCISDNGNVKKTGGTGMGLSNMQDRAEALGGIMRIDTDNGFKIFISIKKEGLS